MRVDFPEPVRPMTARYSPAWAEKSAYLLALAEDRKVILSEEKSRRGKKPPEKLEEPPADPPAGESGETE